MPTVDLGLSAQEIRECERAVAEWRIAAWDKPLAELAVVQPDPSRVAALYIVDEPEAHLHPGAIGDVADWLVGLARRSAGVIVATHSDRFLRLSPSDATLFHVSRDANGDVTLAPLGIDAPATLDSLASALGLSPLELMARTRVALFVEGVHDQIILEELLGREFALSGIRIFTVSGTRNLSAILDSQLATSLGWKLATLTDRTSPPEPGRPASPEEKELRQLQLEAQHRGVDIRTFGLARPDILEYLPAAVIQTYAPRFPGWGEALEHVKRQRRLGDWKRAITEEFGVDLSRHSIRRLARDAKALHRVPAELRRLAEELAVLAADE